MPPLESEDEPGRRLCEYLGTILQAHQEGPKHYQHEEILRFVQQALDDINWTIDQAGFDDLVALKEDSALGLDGTSHGVYRCAGGLGSKFLYRAYQAVLEGRNIPECLPKIGPSLSPRRLTSMTFGRNLRSLDALRPLSLCNFDCKLVTSAICRGLHWYTMRCIHSFAEMYLFQGDDGQHL